MLRWGGDGKGSRARLAVGESHKHLKNNTCSGVADETQDPATTSSRRRLSTKSREGQSYRIGRLRRVSPFIVTSERIAFVGLNAPQCKGICFVKDDADETVANDLDVGKCL
jgi:hypothetical protein